MARVKFMAIAKIIVQNFGQRAIGLELNFSIGIFLKLNKK